MRDARLEISLLIMRLAIAAFMLVWAIDKVIAPEHAKAVFSNFYFSEPSAAILSAIGIAQISIIAAFAVGLARFWSYGAILLMHTASTGSTYSQLLSPWGGERPQIAVLGSGAGSGRNDRTIHTSGSGPAVVDRCLAREATQKRRTPSVDRKHHIQLPQQDGSPSFPSSRAV